jgi:glycosyltransferase involved in cell wall biosynthesis
MRIAIAIGSLPSGSDRIPAFQQTIEAVASQPAAADRVAFVAPGDEPRRSACARVPGLRIVSRDLASFAQRRNALIAETSGDWVIFIEEGCIPGVNWLSSLDAALEDASAGSIAFALYDACGRTMAESISRQFLSHSSYLPLSASAVRRSSIALSGAYDESLIEPSLAQLDLCQRLEKAGFHATRAEGAVFSGVPIPETLPVLSDWKKWYEEWILVHLSSPRGSFRSRLRDALAILHSTTDRIALFGTNPAFFTTYAADTDAAIESALQKSETAWRRIYQPAALPRPPVTHLRDVLDDSGKPLTICMLSQEYPPGVVGGVGRMTAELARGFVREGHSVHVITRSPSTSKTTRVDDGVFVHSVCPVPSAMPPAGVLMPAHLWQYSRAVADKVHSIAEQNHIDLIDGPLWDAEGLAVILDRKWTCITNLETPLHVMLELNPEWLASEENRLTMETLLAAEKSVVSASHGIRAISAAILSKIQTAYDVDLSGCCHAVVPIGIRDEPVRSTPQKEDVVEVLFVGRFERRKGIDVLLEVIPPLCREFPSLHFTLAGPDREIVSSQGGNRTMSFASTYAADPILSQVSFAGAIGDDELEEYYRRCDIFVAPSLYESFGIVYLEAMRAAKPVVGCRVGGIPEVVEDGVTGLLCAPGDAKGLHSAITSLVTDAPRRREMGRAGRERFEQHFTIERTISRTIDFYRSVLASRTRFACQEPE